MEKQQSDWMARRAGVHAGDVPQDLERLRSDLEACDPSVGSWQAACLKSVADLLDSLDGARREQDDLARRLAALHTDLETESAKRQRLKDTLAELEGQATGTRAIEESLATAEVEAAAARDEVQRLRAELAQAETERDEWNAALEKVRSGQTALDASREELAAVRGELDASRAALAETTSERDDLAERLKDYDSVEQGRAELDERVEALRRECGQLRQNAEQNLVEMCDMRVQLNRLEAERDEAVRERKRKVKKILSKVHEDLDEAGAPRGEDLSFGERIRWLKKQLES